ncbi:quinoprotein dehydrogenase-associated putative ABC transporter substrate-binding protein [Phyllobacterium endophyticum]|uniref:Quinoprotein dehydrogenase-associated putative ABC transporter substrate-binding protein n=1 Tax=Phyllobacterium endophyticum TaxID=1149773 RepID=A0A2P7ARW3_9HYPH|nr:quinoprotein dehydrogenase-associated putative ABC transporter substrate-binding protein [Phyllobacterium endophyticum]MBB3236592.1 mxaJ protein [Phyllobacterium endophyticum]PSH56910.1 quinoprotein dehydrogenase-associated putative ABC transporter substrate-binding protein [Phyllobacterium endophyticum]TYR39588.1 quinoprotein dehydrogenase-associated putative ABC transporter substrate-binding protein [Phyllobacterium endophyticum]
MFSASHRLLVFTALISAVFTVAADTRELRVCADPNNLPFSNKDENGFENRIIRILADELNAEVTYVWWAQRRGFVRETLQARRCDIVPGTAASMGMLSTTKPYYRSTYVFVTRRSDNLHISSLDDPLLHSKRIGVQLVGDDGSNTPPAHALARRGLAKNMRGYPVYGNYADAAPGREVISALDRGDIDIAVVWGPTAGYFALLDNVKLEVMPVTPQIDLPMLPMVFDIAMGVRREDAGLRSDIDAAMAKRRKDIDAVLAAYGVPRSDIPGAEK